MTTLLPGTSFTLEVQPVYDLREIALRCIDKPLTDLLDAGPAATLQQALFEEEQRHQGNLEAIRDRAVAELGLPEDAAIDPDNGYGYV